MKNEVFIVSSNESIAKDVYRMHLIGDTRQIGRAGQFVNIALQGHYLRRPISVCDADETGFTIIYKTVGEGTRRMAGMQRGQRLEVLVGLGNGFDADACPKACTLVGGGVGVPPMYALARELVKKGHDVTAILGFNSKADVFYEQQFRDLGCTVYVTTVDGSYGHKGFATDVMQEGAYACACGPKAMLRAVYDKAGDGQFSFEERMGCGFGACMGCTCQTKEGPKRVCKEGPVFFKEAIQW
jgi:dihydroorotate dehydrogenase electron transfer subunit